MRDADGRAASLAGWAVGLVRAQRRSLVPSHYSVFRAVHKAERRGDRMAGSRRTDMEWTLPRHLG